MNGVAAAIFTRDSLLAAEPRIEQVAEGVAHQVEGQHGQHDGEPGERGDPRAALDVLAALAQDVAPARRGRRDAEPEEGQAGLGADGGRDIERGHHHEGVERAREHVARPDPELAAAEGARGEEAVLPPCMPATMPSGTPSAKPKITEARPTCSEIRAPQMMRLKTSRPNSSVPRTWRSCAPGPLRTASAYWADGLRGARSGAAAATTTMVSAMRTPMTIGP